MRCSVLLDRIDIGPSFGEFSGRCRKAPACNSGFHTSIDVWYALPVNAVQACISGGLDCKLMKMRCIGFRVDLSGFFNALGTSRKKERGYQSLSPLSLPAGRASVVPLRFDHLVVKTHNQYGGCPLADEQGRVFSA